jgi:hypothetical protein
MYRIPFKILFPNSPSLLELNLSNRAADMTGVGTPRSTAA